MIERTAYAATKLAWHPDAVRRLRAGRLPRPVFLQVHPTGRCNLRCRWCLYGSEVTPRLQRARVDLPFELYRDLLEDFWALGGRAVEFSGGGEPTLHPRFVEMAELVLARGLEVGLITNGVPPNPAHVLALVPRLEWLRVSVDASTPEEYAERKGIDRWRELGAFIRCAARMKRGNTVGVSYLIDERTTTEELRRAVANAEDWGVDVMRIGPIYDEARPTRLATATREELESLRVQHNLVVDMTGTRERAIARKDAHPPRRCYVPYTTAVVGSDGKVAPCCFLLYSERTRIGDLTQEGFAHWWYSEGRRRTLAEWNRSRMCQGVICSGQDKNDVAYALVENKPAHLNFI